MIMARSPLGIAIIGSVLGAVVLMSLSSCKCVDDLERHYKAEKLLGCDPQVVSVTGDGITLYRVSSIGCAENRKGTDIYFTRHGVEQDEQ